MNIDNCMEFIRSYSKSGGKITDLSRAENLMKLVGNPEKNLKFVHVAGTNGKGSTVEYISNALIYSGYKTGQFTSPFVLHYTDRIRINGSEIDERSLCRICEFIRTKIDGKPYSQFEITMAIAFLWYVQEKCDIVVLETGIGGLLDCTNVIPPPLVSVITSISPDHTALLGETVEEIAVHKAGIIKNGSAVILSEDNSEEVRKIVLKTAENQGAEYVPCEPCIPYSDGGFVCPFMYRGIKLTPRMAGIHQKYNAQTAITACLYLRRKGFEISDGKIIKTVETAYVPGRLQYIDGEPPVIVDGGHNPAGINMLAMSLMYLETRGKRIYTVMGMVDSKDYIHCIRTVANHSDKLWAVDGFASNAVPAETVADIAGFCTDAEALSLGYAVEKAKRSALESNGVVVVCGSLYLASEYLNNCENN